MKTDFSQILRQENGSQKEPEENGDEINFQLEEFFQKGEEMVSKYIERKRKRLMDNLESEKKKEIEQFKEGLEYTVLKHNLKIIDSKVKGSVNKEEKIILLNEEPKEKEGVIAGKKKQNQSFKK